MWQSELGVIGFPQDSLDQLSTERAEEYKLLFYKNLILDFRIDFRGDFRIPKCLGLVIEFATDSRFKKEFG